MIQWGAAVRLAMFEHSSLYEAYTGAIIAGKGKTLSNANAVMQQTRFKHEDWARVRFGAGTPWQRCWFVISPPDEKEMQKARKTLKRHSAYDRSAPLIKGNIKFYETKKNKKKTKPIATVTNAYSAYAIYPQSTTLIDQSTLVKIEGQLTTHAPVDSTTEGLVFVMPENHAAVSGFETMLRFLIPVFDAFHLYGRPNRLIAATNHIKSIMFAFPKHRRYGYLDSLDITSLMQTPGSPNWSEAEWRRQLKEATMRRMSGSHTRTSSMSSTRPKYRASIPNPQSNGRADGPPVFATTPHINPALNQSVDNIIPEKRREEPVSPLSNGTPGRLQQTQGPHSDVSPVLSEYHLADQGSGSDNTGSGSTNYHSSSEKDWKSVDGAQETMPVRGDFVPPSPPAPVSSPPAFTHRPGQAPAIRPRPSLDARRANNRMSSATMMQLAAASNIGTVNGGVSPTSSNTGKITEHVGEEEEAASDNNPYATQARGLGVSEINWRASSEVIAAPKPVSPMRQSTPSSNGSPSPVKNRLSLDTTKAVKRKPLPQTKSRDLGLLSPGGEPSFDDLRHTVDEDALNRVGLDPLARSPAKHNLPDEESVYDDMSPDYASTHESVNGEWSFREPKPRMGVMKTVGGDRPGSQNDLAVGDSQYSVEQPRHPKQDIPNVDFGPTMTYLPTIEQQTSSETLKDPGHQASASGSDVTERQRIHVPTHGLNSSQSSRDERRWSTPWMADSNSPLSSPRHDKYPAGRSDPNLPNQPHHRGPLGTSSSQHPGSTGRMLPPRPNAHKESSRNHPRGPAGMTSRNEVASQLSAREQEHVARMTGSSFFNLVPGTNGQHQPQTNPRGLVGAIDARQREKRGIKEGMSNHMVQHAIAQRQQHNQHPAGPRSPAAPMYGAEQYSAYNLPAAGHSVGRFSQSHPRADDPRQSWYSAQQVLPPAYSQQAPNYSNLH